MAGSGRTVTLAELDAAASRLADRIGLTTGSVTSMLDRLEKTGCVTRSPHPSDRRKVIVRATETARDACGGIRLIYPDASCCYQDESHQLSPAHRHLCVRSVAGPSGVVRRATSTNASGWPPAAFLQIDSKFHTAITWLSNSGHTAAR
jgi:hypothetical protein